MPVAPIIRAMAADEAAEVCTLVARVFNASVAPRYSEQGVNEFLSHVRPGEVRLRLERGHSVLVAVQDDRIVGVAEVRDGRHISLLFVECEFHKRGIGRELVRRVLKSYGESRSELSAVTVNSSPNAVSFYQRLGFEPCGREQTIHGVSFIPMILRSPERNGPGIS